MAYVTEDTRVKKIVAQMRVRAISEAEARRQLKALPHENGKPKGWLHDSSLLDWEIEEAIKSGERAA